MTYVYPNTLCIFRGKRETALSVGYVEVEDSVYADLVETKKMWQNGEIVDDPTYPERKAQEEEEAERRAREQAIIDEVNELKKKLADSDYAIIKIAEGAAEREEYAELIVQRQAWRDRINELEN